MREMWKETLQKRLSEKERVLLAIDGPCASGKTGFAEKLSREFDGIVIHMDDFFLRPEQRTEARYAEPGGNLDRERFSEEVLLPLKKGELFSYRPFDCEKMALGDPVAVPMKKLFIVEGSYSMHPYFGKPYDLSIFLTVSPETQKHRLELRSPEKLDRFLSRWIPMEEAYFDAFSVRERCDYILNSEKDLFA